MKRPVFLYHGSAKLLKIIEPFQAHDWGYAEGCKKAVYVTSDRNIAIAFALGARPDENGNVGRLMDKKYDKDNKMIFYQGHPNFGAKGYLYKLSSEGFTYTRGTQWVNSYSVTPVDTTEINVDDFPLLWRYATDKEKQQIEREICIARNKKAA